MEENAAANQKGGIGKTTTTLNLGVGLAKQGEHVLLVATDPQGSLTASLHFSIYAKVSLLCSEVINKSNCLL